MLKCTHSPASVCIALVSDAHTQGIRKDAQEDLPLSFPRIHPEDRTTLLPGCP